MTDVAARRREFDFWIGEWDVTDPGGAPAGRNRIEPILDGMALREEWTGTSGLRGASISAYDASRGVWHQTWIDSSGGLLLLDGGPQAGAMVLEGVVADAADGVATRHRITWRAESEDGVRQLWETSIDGGATWTTVFDGRYARLT